MKRTPAARKPKRPEFTAPRPSGGTGARPPYKPAGGGTGSRPFVPRAPGTGGPPAPKAPVDPNAKPVRIPYG